MVTFRQRPFRILTLDGGGYRGIASLVILKALLRQVDPNVDEGEHKPGQYFDLIGGTSTGGLIALMFGRLGMTVNEAIEKYNELAPKIFEKDGGLKDFLRNGARYSSAPFEQELAQWLPNETLSDPNQHEPGHTHCFATTVPSDLKQTSTATLLRSYKRPVDDPDNSGGHKWLVQEAARATSAALSFFKPMTVGRGFSFKDAGGSGFNNPTLVAVTEARENHLFGTRGNFCIVVSLGTGLADLTKRTSKKRKASKGWMLFGIPYMVQSIRRAKNTVQVTIDDLVSAATNTESIHQDACRQFEHESEYFRFNPNNGLGNFDLADIFVGTQLEQQTVAFLKQPETNCLIKKCADILRQDMLEVPKKVLAHANVLGGGYLHNFIEPTADMIGELRQPMDSKFPTKLCKPVPRDGDPLVHGLIVVMPPSKNNAKSDAFERALREYNVEHLVLHGPRQMRTVYFAYGFIIDFPRTLNVLSHPENYVPAGDAETFEAHLNSNSQSTLVTVVPWTRFEQVMKYLKVSQSDHQFSWRELEERVPKESLLAISNAPHEV